jgi:hypothetical protein
MAGKIGQSGDAQAMLAQPEGDEATGGIEHGQGRKCIAAFDLESGRVTAHRVDRQTQTERAGQLHGCRPGRDHAGIGLDFTLSVTTERRRPP